jgi:transcription elongation factor Elf1
VSGDFSPRVQPFYCPYCGEEDFVPFGPPGSTGGDFHCRSCDRRFEVRFLGLGAPDEETAEQWASDIP